MIPVWLQLWARSSYWPKSCFHCSQTAQKLRRKPTSHLKNSGSKACTLAVERNSFSGEEFKNTLRETLSPSVILTSKVLLSIYCIASVKGAREENLGFTQVIFGRKKFQSAFRKCTFQDFTNRTGSRMVAFWRAPAPKRWDFASAAGASEEKFGDFAKQELENPPKIGTASQKFEVVSAEK